MEYPIEKINREKVTLNIDYIESQGLENILTRIRRTCVTKEHVFEITGEPQTQEDKLIISFILYKAQGILGTTYRPESINELYQNIIFSFEEGDWMFLSNNHSYKKR